MIDHTFHFLTEYLNTEFKLLYGIDEDKVVMGNLVDPDGNTAASDQQDCVITGQFRTHHQCSGFCKEEFVHWRNYAA